MYSYLKEDNVVEIFKTAKQYTDNLTDNFTEFERIARNKPHGSIPKEYPKTTDGTTASIIRKTPHRIIQQLPTGKVKSTTEDWLSVVAEFIYTEKIIPNANEGYALLQKCWNVVERFLTFGFCATYAPFVQHGSYFCPDLRLPYWGDIFLQPGKLSDADSNYVFLRSWWQTKDIEALISAQEKLKKPTWNVENLRKIKEQVASKDNQSQTPVEREKDLNAKGGVELITGFQRGKKAKFYTFHVSSGLIARIKENKDPRGEIPVSFAYGDIDGSNPFGRSVIDLVGSLQNLMDGEMQMYQYNRALQLNPPLIKRGSWSKNKIKFVPNVIIDMGSGDPNTNSLEALKIDTTALANFPNNYGLMKSQMINLLASPDTSISAEVGNPGFSKTPQGVELSKANLSIDDNYVRKQFETWFERWSETAINLYFAEREGVEELQLNKETIAKLLELAKTGRFNPELLNEEGKIRINYSSVTPTLKFEVDASTSKKQDELRELQSLEGLRTILDKSSIMRDLVPMEKQMGLWNAMVDNSGTENPEKLKLNDKEIQEAIQKMADRDPPPRENLITNYKDLPEDIKRQQEANLGFQPSKLTSPTQQASELKAASTRLQAANIASQQPPQPPAMGLTPEDQQLVAQLQKMGASPDIIQRALAMLHQGMPVEKIIQMVVQALGATNAAR